MSICCWRFSLETKVTGQPSTAACWCPDDGPLDRRETTQVKIYVSSFMYSGCEDRCVILAKTRWLPPPPPQCHSACCQWLCVITGCVNHLSGFRPGIGRFGENWRTTPSDRGSRHLNQRSLHLISPKQRKSIIFILPSLSAINVVYMEALRLLYMQKMCFLNMFKCISIIANRKKKNAEVIRRHLVLAHWMPSINHPLIVLAAVLWLRWLLDINEFID